MAPIFKVIASENSRTGCILLYGDIGDSGWSDITSNDVVRELLQLESQYDKIDVRINSVGGEVFAGLAIFNAFRNSKADITIYIDGIAASMAAAIAMSRRPVHMSKYARLMIHSGSTGTYGNATRLKEALNLLESINETLIEIFSERTGQTKEEIKKKYFDDKDHYFSAQEALDLKLIDGIYDMEPLPATAVTAEKIYDIILKRLNKKTKMDLLALLKQRPGFSACADEAAVLAHIATLEAQAEKGGRVESLEKEVTSLKASVKAYEDKEAAALKAEIASLVSAAVADGRIKEPQRAVYTSLLEKDFDSAKAALESLPKARRVTRDIDYAGGETEKTARQVWDERMETLTSKQ